MTELSDELLVAYVDGQLARAQTRAVEKVLKHDEVIARRVDALKEAHGRLESAFEAILAGEVGDITLRADPFARVSHPVPTGKDRRVFSAVLLVLIAAAAGYGLPLIVPELAPQLRLDPAPAQSKPAPKLSERIQSSWQDDAVRAHALMSRASLEVGLDSQGNRDLVAFELAQAIGPTLKVPGLEPEGLKFVRGQLLQYRGDPLGQMLYLAERGAPVALYVMASPADSAPDFNLEGTVGAVSWSQDGVAYLLAGERDEEFLRKLAERIRLEPTEPIPVPPPNVPQLSSEPALPESGVTSSLPPSAAESIPPATASPLPDSSGTVTTPTPAN
jgi:anti-sigma factor RsiW